MWSRPSLFVNDPANAPFHRPVLRVSESVFSCESQLSHGQGLFVPSGTEQGIMIVMGPKGPKLDIYEYYIA